MLITQQEFKVLIEKYKKEGMKEKQIKQRIKQFLEELKDTSEYFKFKKIANL